MWAKGVELAATGSGAIFGEAVPGTNVRAVAGFCLNGFGLMWTMRGWMLTGSLDLIGSGGARCRSNPGGAATATVARKFGLMSGCLGTALWMIILEPCAKLKEKEMSGEAAGNTLPGIRLISLAELTELGEGHLGRTASKEGCRGSTAAWVSLGSMENVTALSIECCIVRSEVGKNSDSLSLGW